MLRLADEARQSGERGRGRPRDARLDAAILLAAERQLRERGFAGMSLESVADEAGTTVPSLRRRYANKTSLAVAVVDSLRIEPLRTPRTAHGPREQVLAVLENFRVNLEREHAMALLGTLLAEEQRNPELLQRFRSRLVGPRRTLLADAVKAAVRGGELPPETDVDVIVNMMIGSFYARYVSHGRIPRDWPRRLVRQIWPPRRPNG
jgi:AcrR family transcriptional regulator